MPDPAVLLLFVPAVLALLLSPGPNMAFLLAHAGGGGWRAGAAAALGIFWADLLLTAAVASGLGAVVAAWPPAFDLIRWAGALMLLLWAWRSARQALSDGQGGPSALRVGAERLRRVAAQAALNCLLNPKALLFFLVFLPQFVNAEQGGVAVQLLLLGLLLSLLALAFHLLLAGLAAQVAGRLQRSAGARWRRALGLLQAGLYLGLALRLLGLSRDGVRA